MYHPVCPLHPPALDTCLDLLPEIAYKRHNEICAKLLSFDQRKFRQKAGYVVDTSAFICGPRTDGVSGPHFLPLKAALSFSWTDALYLL